MAWFAVPGVLAFLLEATWLMSNPGSALKASTCQSRLQFNCTDSLVIHILDAFQGISANTSVSTRCRLQEGDKIRRWSAAALSSWRYCHLRQSCILDTHLDEDTFALSYVEVEYECVSPASLPLRDICRSGTFDASHAVFHSPGYPDPFVHTGSVRCLCQFTIDKSMNLTITSYNDMYIDRTRFFARDTELRVQADENFDKFSIHDKSATIPVILGPVVAVGRTTEWEESYWTEIKANKKISFACSGEYTPSATPSVTPVSPSTVTSSENGLNKISTCLKRIEIVCGAGSLIIIYDSFIGRPVSGAERCHFKTGDVREDIRAGSFIVMRHCNMRESCDIPTHLGPESYKSYLEIHYKCENVSAVKKHDMCAYADKTGHKTVYLHSPGYGGFFTTDQAFHCKCTIQVSQTTTIFIRIYSRFYHKEITRGRFEKTLNVSFTELIQKHDFIGTTDDLALTAMGSSPLIEGQFWWMIEVMGIENPTYERAVPPPPYEVADPMKGHVVLSPAALEVQWRSSWFEPSNGINWGGAHNPAAQVVGTSHA